MSNNFTILSIFPRFINVLLPDQDFQFHVNRIAIDRNIQILILLFELTPAAMNKEIESGLGSVKQFTKDSIRFLEVCEKPDVTEFKKIAQSCALGFAIMGGIGYVVKLLFIPINNIILS